MKKVKISIFTRFDRQNSNESILLCQYATLNMHRENHREYSKI